MSKGMEYFEKGNAHFKAGEFDRAIECYQEAAKLLAEDDAWLVESLIEQTKAKKANQPQNKWDELKAGIAKHVIASVAAVSVSEEIASDIAPKQGGVQITV
jgi:tetratricopeptide (TPR) repeat protein